MRTHLLVASVCILSSCSGGGESGSSNGTETTNAPPTVSAGADQSVLEAETVQLSGSASDPDGDSLTYRWTQVSGPTISLSDATLLSPSFTAPDVESDQNITLRLSVEDGSNAAVSDEVTISVGQAEESVDAGFGRIVPPGELVSLNATVGSGIISWQQIEGTAVTLSDPSVEDPSFTAPNVSARETLVFELSVDTGSGTLLTDTVFVEVWVGADSTSDLTVLADYSDRSPWPCTVDPIAATEVSFTDSGGVTLVEANGIPLHATGSFPNNGNPNAITDQNVSFSFTNSPELAASSTEMSVFGVTLDGIKLERDTAESYQNAGVWRYEAVTPALARQLTGLAEFNYLGTDCNNAHVQPNGQYHYHGLMEGTINRLGETNGVPDDLILGGYAADGFPFYLRYGYVDASDSSSGLIAMEGSWEVQSGTRPDGPAGSYDGTFRNDWEYVDGSGDLDECNGRFGPTPEYPEGIYHYYITDDYPYIPRCVKGTPDSSFRRLED